MQKRTFIILIVCIVFLGILGFFLVMNQGSIPRVPVEETQEPEFIPFSGVGLGGENIATQETQEVDIDTLEGRQNFNDFDAVDTNLVQISSQPVAGYTLFSKIFEIVEDPQELLSEDLVETYNFLQFPVLKIGDTGEGVSALQTVLNRLYPNSSIPTSGTFDTATKNAVIAFQTEHKLTADGIVGGGTKAKLNEVQGLSKNPKDFEPIVQQEERFTVRYQNKKNGYIFDLGIDDKKFEQVSSLGFSAVHESFFGNNGEKVVIRYADEDSISTYSGSITKNESDAWNFDGKFMTQNIPFVSINPDGTKMVYFENLGRRTRGYVVDLKTDIKKLAFDSKFSEWLPQFIGPEFFALTTRASALSLGYSYVYNANEKDSFTKGVGGFSGLTTNYNSSGTKVLYSTNNGGRFIETYIFDRNDGTTLSLGIRTLAEKCVWTDLDNLLCAVPQFVGPEDYPDAWYKGEVLFDDRLWSVNTENGVERMVSSFRQAGLERVDMVNPIYKNGILLFQNKYDYTLWMLDLREE